MLTLLLVLLSGTPGASLELEGLFEEAGEVYGERSNHAGTARIESRRLEEALYAGRASEAFDIIQLLETYPVSRSLVAFWYARLAWCCGLPVMAVSELEEPGEDDWLTRRAAGMALQMRGRPEDALPLLVGSLGAGETVRERFYSAVDISMALCQTGRFGEAEEIARWLMQRFPGEGLPTVVLGLSLQGQGRYGEAMTALQWASSDTTYGSSVRAMASDLLEELE